MYLTELVPQEIDEVTLAYPANVQHLMPEYNSIPEEFRNMNYNHRCDDPSKADFWLRFQSDWMFTGLKVIKTDLKEGIDGDKAWRHLSAIQGSYEPKHEHKMAAVAYLASLWFNNIEYKKGKEKV